MHRVNILTGYEPQELIEKTLYQFVHVSDQESLKHSHLKCKSRGLIKKKEVWFNWI